MMTFQAIQMVLAITTIAVGGQALANPIEVGDVKWGRDFNAALRQSADTGKPVFLLFQEVPGCSGVREFGQEVLTHPGLVQAIETEFIPMLVYNNRSNGMDRELLERYGEPAWNYQVIRFLNADGRDVIPRKDRVWTLRGVAARMVQALNAAGQAVPENLKALAN